MVIHAKERQAAEANKNASTLLQELDQEKVCSQIILSQNDVINNMVQLAYGTENDHDFLSINLQMVIFL